MNGACLCWGISSPNWKGSLLLSSLLRWRDRRQNSPGFIAAQSSWLSLIYSSLIPRGFERRNGRFLVEGSAQRAGVGKVAKGVEKTARLSFPTLQIPKVLVRDGGEGWHLSSPHSTDEQTEALGLEKTVLPRKWPREALEDWDLPQWVKDGRSTSHMAPLRTWPF